MTRLLRAMQRRLAAILVADVVGYSRLMESNEEVTHAWMMLLRAETLDPGIEQFGGRLVKNTGDGFVAVFDTAHDGIACARLLQESVTAQTAHQPPHQRIMFRMAVNVADIIVEKDDVYGDGVNVAARLQTYAEPGGITISGAVAEQLGPDLGVRVTDMGDLPLRNRTRRVRVFALHPPVRALDGRRVVLESWPVLTGMSAQMAGCDAEDLPRQGLVGTVP